MFSHSGKKVREGFFVISNLAITAPITINYFLKQTFFSSESLIKRDKATLNWMIKSFPISRGTIIYIFKVVFTPQKLSSRFLNDIFQIEFSIHQGEFACVLKNLMQACVSWLACISTNSVQKVHLVNY